MIKKLQNGFTLAELLIVVTLIALLTVTILATLNFRGQTAKAHDTIRKSDIQKLRVAFEAYYSDYECYPTQDQINNCDSSDLEPYIKHIPCDPLTKSPYHLELLPDVCPQKFGILANLELTTDPVIAQQGCITGCGTNNQYNYIVTSGDASASTFTTAPSSTPTTTTTTTPTSTPTPPGTVYYYCSAINDCTSLPSNYTCPGYQLFTNNLCSSPPRNCSNETYVCNPTPL